MRNILLFIRRYFNFLLFLLLQVISIYLIVHYSNYHHSVFGGFANTITGKVNSKYSSIQNYFHLRKTNDSLVKANEILYNKLKADYSLGDSASKSVLDSIKVDSIMKFKRYTYLSARVISNSVSSQNNFIVLSRENSGPVKEGMGVVDINSNVVGIVTEVNSKYAIVMSLLHKDSRISGRLLKGGETGTLNWDGKEPNMVTLTNISKSAKIAVGDSVITSGGGYSIAFPMNLLIGRVEGVYEDPSTNYYKVRFKTAANFYNLQYVYVIQNSDQEVAGKVLDSLKKIR